MRQSSSKSSPTLFTPEAGGRDPVRAFARAVAGALHPQSVLDSLAGELKATFGPRPLALKGVDQQGLPGSANGLTEHPDWDALLQNAIQSRRTEIRHAGTSDTVAVPILGRNAVLGAIAIHLDRGADDAALALLEQLAAVAGLALESAILVAAADHRHHTWEDAAEALGLALAVLDRGGRVELGNRAFLALAGSPPGGVTGRLWSELLPDDWHHAVSGALKGAAPEDADLRIGNRTITVTAYCTIGPATGRHVLLFADETERRRLQDRLIQSEKLTAIGQLIAGVAHDLNNPLTSVIGFADFLAESADVPPRIREPLRVIQQEAERASKIVKNLLSFARRREARQPAALRPILEATLGLFRNNLSVDQVSLSSEIADDLPDLDLNPTQIQQVFVNLIQNAAHAIAAGGRAGTIRLSARRWMEGVAVEVSDDGPGMAPDVAERIFEPFFSTKPEELGTGLGLSMSQGIVKEHGGRITLTTSPGQGATLRVELPGRVPATAAPTPSPPPATERPLHVLVVDDEPHILHYLRATLEAWGHTVTTVADGQAGLEQAIAETYDLIITDLRMPRTGGREFYETLRQRKPEAAARIAFTTGDTVRDDTLDFLESQGKPWLHKPYSLAELRALLRAASRG